MDNLPQGFVKLWLMAKFTMGDTEKFLKKQSISVHTIPKDAELQHLGGMFSKKS